MYRNLSSTDYEVNGVVCDIIGDNSILFLTYHKIGEKRIIVYHKNVTEPGEYYPEIANTMLEFNFTPDATD